MPRFSGTRSSDLRTNRLKDKDYPRTITKYILLSRFKHIELLQAVIKVETLYCYRSANNGHLPRCDGKHRHQTVVRADGGRRESVSTAVEER